MLSRCALHGAAWTTPQCFKGEDGPIVLERIPSFWLKYLGTFFGFKILIQCRNFSLFWLFGFNFENFFPLDLAIDIMRGLLLLIYTLLSSLEIISWFHVSSLGIHYRLGLDHQFPWIEWPMSLYEKCIPLDILFARSVTELRKSRFNGSFKLKNDQTKLLWNVDTKVLKKQHWHATQSVSKYCHDTEDDIPTYA